MSKKEVSLKMKEGRSIDEEIFLFINHLESLREMLPMTMGIIQEVDKLAFKTLEAFRDKYCEKQEDKDGETLVIPPEKYKEWKKKKRQFEKFRMGRILMPRSLLVTMISQYDAFLGRLLRAMFVHKPELINKSEKNYSFSDVSSFTSIDVFRDYVIEKEVELILRKSHSDQFKHMERLFDIKLTKDLKVWPIFIELTERRNLFVHADGEVSSQYIKVCNEHGCSLDSNIKEGSTLKVPQEYFECSYNCIFEIGIKLGHVLWRKILPAQIEDADVNFNNATFDLIEREEYDLACTLMDFACASFKKQSNDYNKSMLIVNSAQAHKWAGRNEECIKIMKSCDWSAKGNEFKLADAVLFENWDSCKDLMKKIGDNDDVVKRIAYRDWPLFKEFRKQKEFLETYKEVFDEEFKVNDTMPKKKKNFDK